jgi:O-antigen/teichoic acid export membrane protein
MSFFRKAILINSAALVSFVIRLAQTIVLSRVLGPALVGQYAVITAALLLATQISALGFPIAYLYYSQHDPERAKTYQTNCIWAGLGLGLIGGTVIGLLVAWRNSYFGRVPWYACVALGAYVLFMIQTGVARNTLLRQVKARQLSAMTISSTVGSFALVALFALVGWLTVGTALICFATLQMIRMAVGWGCIRSEVDFAIKPSRAIISKLGRMGIRQGWVDIMVLLNATLNVMIIKFLVSDFESIGYFSRGLQVAMLVVTASQAVLPLLFSRWAALAQDQLARHFEKVMRFVTTFSVIVVLFILISAEWVVLLLFGPEYLPAVKPMRILLPGTMLYLLSKIVIQFLGSRGLPEISAGLLVLGSLVNALLSFMLIPIYGIRGAAIASTSGNLVLLLCLMAVMVWKYKINVMRCLCLTLGDCKHLMRSLA